MKYYIFYRENNDFNDILTDTSLKKVVSERISWDGYLQIGISTWQKNVDQIFSYITLKYGDDIRTDLTKDYSPKPYIDYLPIRK
jgi:hypothetical protein